MPGMTANKPSTQPKPGYEWTYEPGTGWYQKKSVAPSSFTQDASGQVVKAYNQQFQTPQQAQGAQQASSFGTYGKPAGNVGMAGMGAPATQPFDIDSLMSKYGPPAPQPIAKPAPVSPLQYLDPESGNALAFARAKDRISLNNRAMIDALHNAMSERGTAGSGAESKETGKIIAGGGANLADFAAQQGQAGYARQNEVQNTNYQGALNQRGQDIGLAQAEQDRMDRYNQNRLNAFMALLQLSKGGARY